MLIQKKDHKKSIITAGTWVLMGHLLSQLFRLGGNLILTRLLAPEMFGVMAIVNVLIMGVQMLSDLGLGQSIIHSKRGEDPAFINTAWTLQIIRGGVLWIVICLAAAALWAGNYLEYIPEGQVYAEPLLPWLMVAVGFSAVITGFNSMAICQASRNLILGRLTVLNLLAQLVALAVIIIIALKYQTIWALAAGGLVSSCINMFFSHKVLPGVKNKLYWDRTSLKELFSFGKWIFLSSAIGFIASQGDRLVLGGLLTVEMLGVYSIAFMLSNLPTTIVSQISHTILFPTFSRINRENPDNLKKSLIRSKLWLSILVMPATGFLIVWSPFLIAYLYDERYEAAGWMMSLLLLRVAVGCMMMPSSLVLMAKGLPQYATISATFKAIFIFVVLPKVFNQYGMKEMIFAIGLSGLVDIPILWPALIKHKLFSIRIEVFSITLLLIGYMIAVYSMKVI